jgi:hypothetical protein
LSRGNDGRKRGVLCGSCEMIPYRKFSDIQGGEFGAFVAPNRPKAPKVYDEAANDARSLDGLGALAASYPGFQIEPVRDSVVAHDGAGKNPRRRAQGAKAAKPAKDQISLLLAASSDAGQDRRADWDAEDCQARFDERAGFLEHDGGLVRRAEAEAARAFACCVTEWLNQHPAPSAPGRCAWCGKPETPSAVVLPFGTEPQTHAWLHADCWPAWHQSRQREAVLALREIGITMGGDHDD